MITANCIEITNTSFFFEKVKMIYQGERYILVDLLILESLASDGCDGARGQRDRCSRGNICKRHQNRGNPLRNINGYRYFFCKVMGLAQQAVAKPGN